MAYLNDGIAYLKELAAYYEGPTQLLALFGICLVLLALFGGRKGRAVFFYPMLILLLTVFNPALIGMFLKGAELPVPGFVPYLWMVPVLIVIPAGAALTAARLPHPLLKILPFAAVLAAAVILGVPRPSAYLNLGFPENYFKADSELLTICSYLEPGEGERQVRVAFEDALMEMACGEYTARISTSDLFRTDGDLTKKAVLEAAVKEKAPDYIVCEKDGTTAALLPELGMKAVAHTGRYYIFRNTGEKEA